MPVQFFGVSLFLIFDGNTREEKSSAGVGGKYSAPSIFLLTVFHPRARTIVVCSRYAIRLHRAGYSSEALKINENHAERDSIRGYCCGLIASKTQQLIASYVQGYIQRATWNSQEAEKTSRAQEEYSDFVQKHPDCVS